MRISRITMVVVCMTIVVAVAAVATSTTYTQNHRTTRDTGGSVDLFDDKITVRFILTIPTVMYQGEKYGVNFTVDIDFNDVAFNVTVYSVRMWMHYSGESIAISEIVEYDPVEEIDTDHVVREGTAMIEPLSPAPDSTFMCIVEFSAYNSQSVYGVSSGPSSIDGAPVYSTVLQPSPWLVMTAVLSVVIVLSLYRDSMVSHVSEASGPGASMNLSSETQQ